LVVIIVDFCGWLRSEPIGIMRRQGLTLAEES
jgi:hypothetical protein